MSSQDFMTTRRKFMQRSALGAGGLLFSSMLLASCTDHDIPDPQNPELPILFDPQIAWNDDAKLAVTTALQLVPEVGGFVSGLVDIFWPITKVDVWSEIKEQVEALIDQQIAAQVYTDVQGNLIGLNKTLINYLNEVKNGAPDDIKGQWVTTKNFFELYQPNFQSAGNELPLLPLFGQFANLYLALLRDGVAFGASWGRTAGDQQQDLIDLKTAISDCTTYTKITYDNALFNLMGKTKADSHANEPFSTLNTFNRQMFLTVFDFKDLWAYFDVSLYPNGSSALLTREIYSDPYGSCDRSTNPNPIALQLPTPTQLPTNLTVWSSDRINAVQLTYPANSGPGGVTQTPRMGSQEGSGMSGGTPQTSTFNPLANNPITSVRAFTALYQNNNGILGPFASGMQFQFHDGTTTDILGGVKGVYDNTFYDTGMFGYAYEALSSVYIHGTDTVLGGADCVVFGFMYWQPPAATLRAISAMYVKSPREWSAADFAKAFPKVTIPADLITEELKLARKLYWEYIKERAG